MITQGIIHQIFELILEDRLISAKLITEKLGISRERVGSIIYEDLDRRKLSAKWISQCLNADQKLQLCQSSEQIWKFFRRHPNGFLSRRDWWPWTKPIYITMTRRQSNNQWTGGIAAHPALKKFRVKKSAGIFLASIFGIKATFSSLFIFQRAKLSARSITHFFWCNWRTFWRKNASGSSPRGSCSCTTMPQLTGHLQPRRNWHTWVSSILIAHPILRIWLRRTTACFLDWKNNWKITIFNPTLRSLLPRRPGWTDNLLNFFLFACLAKDSATG